MSAVLAQSPDRETVRRAAELVAERRDLSLGPLFEAKVLKLSERLHTLILILDHMIMDAASSEILIKELWVLYEQGMHGQEFRLPDCTCNPTFRCSSPTMRSGRRGLVKLGFSHTDRDLAQLLDHEHVSLAVAQRCSDISGSMPLFGAILNYRRSATVPRAGWAQINGIRVVTTRICTNSSFALSVDDLGEDFWLTLQIDPQIDPRRIISYVKTALGKVTEVLESSPNTLVQSISVLPECERQLVTQLFNRRRTPFPSEKLIHDTFEEQAARTPDVIAVVGAGASSSFGELNCRANQLARYLRAREVRSDQLVGLCCVFRARVTTDSA
jgi:hypothetical protein